MIKEETYYFNGYSVGEAWETFPGNMVTGNTNGASSQTIQNNKVQLLNSNTCAGTNLGRITKVELRAYCAKNTTGTNDIILRPVFSGGDGDNNSLDEAADASPSPMGAWTSRVDITADTNAPTSWTWTNVKDLDCDVLFTTSGGGKGFAWKVEIIVKYNPGPITKITFIDR